MHDRQIAPHFKLSEFACKCGCEMPPDVERRIVRVATALESVFSPLGTVRVISGYRCAAHNAKEGGAKDSRHVVGDAADIAVFDGERWKPGEWLRGWAESYAARAILPVGGLGTYRSKPFTLHVDLRGERKRWTHD